MLERAGYQITECGDGAEALSLVGQTPFDVILTDLNMPNLGGRALGRALADLPGIKPKVVVFSGSGQGPLSEIAAELGAVATLSKPFSRAELLAVVEAALKS